MTNPIPINGNFFKFPVDWTQVFDSSFKLHHAAIYFCMLNKHTVDTMHGRECRVSTSYLMNALRISNKTVIDDIAVLKEMGLITQIEPSTNLVGASYSVKSYEQYKSEVLNLTIDNVSGEGE